MDDHAIAIIGMTLRLPGADSLPSLWSNLAGGRVSIRHFQREHCAARGIESPLFDHPRYVFADAALPDIDLFDADFFAFSQREAELLDPQQRILLECAWELLETAGYGNPLRRPRIGVYAGASMNTYLPNVIGSRCDLMSLAGTEIMLTNDKDYLCGRISYKLGLTGPSVTVQTGCSTALSSIHCAVQSLLGGECDMALAGGVSVQAVLRPGYLYEPNLMFSPDGMCRPFDHAASGTVFGDGAGLVALRPLGDAKAAGDTILAVILGSAMNNEGDGRLGFTAPGVYGQSRLIAEAQGVAGVGPEDIGMIEAHGTGTALGDPVEFAALREVFRTIGRRAERCALGSIKANVGHLAAAAGIAGLAKVVLALKQAIVPPHPTFSRAHPSLGLEESPFIINRKAEPWPLSGTRRAGISSFGAGGTNVHIVLAEGPPAVAKRAGAGLRAIPLSGSDPDRLKELAADMARHLVEQPDISLDDIYVTLSHGRRIEACKTLLYAHDRSELIAQLNEGAFEIATDVAAPRLIFIIGGDVSYVTAANHPVFNRELTALLERLNEHHPALITRQDVLDKGNAEGEPWGLAQALGSLAYLLMWRYVIATPLLILAQEDSDVRAGGMFSVADMVRAIAGSPPGTTAQPRHPLPPMTDLHSFIGDYLTQSAFGSDRGTSHQAGFFSPRLINEGDRVFIPAHRGEFSTLALTLCRDRGAEAVHGPSASDMPAMLRCAGALWRRGVNINWHNLCHYPDAGRVPLPVQPLRRHRCWYQPEPDEKNVLFRPATSVAEAFSPLATDDRPRLYVERWRRTGRCAAQTGISGPCRRLMIADPACRFASPLMDALKNRGGHITRATLGPAAVTGPDEFRVDPHDPLAADRLADVLLKNNLMPDHLLLLFGDVGTGEVTDASPDVVYVLLELAKAFSQHRRTPLHIDIIGPGFADAPGSGILCPERAAAWAACRSLMQEIPHIVCCCIDVREQPDHLDVRDVMAELTGAHRPSIVALRHGWRWERYAETLQSAAAPTDWQNLTCLVTGGLGRVGYQLARFLAVNYHAKLLVLTRTPLHRLPENDRRQERLRELRSVAPAVEVIHGDIADVGQVAEAVERAEQRIGRINCFIHAAGVSGPATLHWVQKSTREQWQGLMRPSFIGASVLHALLGRRPLRFGCFTSSLAAYAGGLGLAAYAAANEACASFALRHGRRHPYLCIDWAGWRGWDTGGSLKYSASRDLPLTAPEAAAAFGLCLGNMHQGRLAVSISPPIGFKDYSAPPQGPEQAPAGASGDSSIGAGDVNCSSAAALADANGSFSIGPADVTEALIVIWRDLLHCEVDNNANFFDLGGDSLVGAELVHRINAHFNIMLTMVDLFEAAAVESLTPKIVRALAAALPAREAGRSETGKGDGA
ncbi:SDR family NAD(P)-dependent oxidoreductase [Sodalis sp. dw_96]|uniref:SDR family NAD(P)-dependent oxidoreductase n=1 Tax=Sodalis sp. dw_96 TaxID=2719794 RepID=UPI001BD607C9|nr:SDR family NAD(P)-dependent oxidoreductase [Sodalis sp. dw_96]